MWLGTLRGHTMRAYNPSKNKYSTLLRDTQTLNPAPQCENI